MRTFSSCLRFWDINSAFLQTVRWDWYQSLDYTVNTKLEQAECRIIRVAVTEFVDFLKSWPKNYNIERSRNNIGTKRHKIIVSKITTSMSLIYLLLMAWLPKHLSKAITVHLEVWLEKHWTSHLWLVFFTVKWSSGTRQNMSLTKQIFCKWFNVLYL